MSFVHHVVENIPEARQSAMRLGEAREIMSRTPDPASWRSMTNFASAHYLVGSMLSALAFAREAVALERNTSTLYNLGVILEGYGQFTEARQLAEEIHAADPGNHLITNLLAEGLLRDGEWRAAWPIYVMSYVVDTPLHRYIPKWTGRESLRGKRLLILQNGGIGDGLHFCRYFHRLNSWGARLTYCGPETLTPLFAAQGFVEQVIPTHGPTQVIDRIELSYDYITTMMELPGILDLTLDDVQWRGPYITPPPVTKRIPHSTRPLVGLAWMAGEYVYPRRRRSLDNAQRDRLLACDRVDWVNLQPEEFLEGHRNPDVRGWSATAAVVSQLDLVVSVDTAAAHLAGAMAKPVWVPLCGASAGMFLRDRPDLPYYPTMTLFRNLDFGIDHAVTRIVEALRELY